MNFTEYLYLNDIINEGGEISAASIAFKHVKILRDKYDKVATLFPDVIKSTKNFINNGFPVETITTVMNIKSDLIFKVDNFLAYCEGVYKETQSEAMLYLINVLKKILNTIEHHYNKIRELKSYKA